MKFSEGTKNGLRQVNAFSGDVYKFSSGTARQIIGYGQQIAIDAVKQNSGAQKVSSTESFGNLKDGILNIVKVVINVYDGVV